MQNPGENQQLLPQPTAYGAMQGAPIQKSPMTMQAQQPTPDFFPGFESFKVFLASASYLAAPGNPLGKGLPLMAQTAPVQGLNADKNQRTWGQDCQSHNKQVGWVRLGQPIQGDGRKVGEDHLRLSEIGYMSKYENRCYYITLDFCDMEDKIVARGVYECIDQAISLWGVDPMDGNLKPIGWVKGAYEDCCRKFCAGAFGARQDFVGLGDKNQAPNNTVLGMSQGNRSKGGEGADDEDWFAYNEAKTENMRIGRRMFGRYGNRGGPVQVQNMQDLSVSMQPVQPCGPSWVVAESLVGSGPGMVSNIRWTTLVGLLAEAIAKRVLLAPGLSQRTWTNDFAGTPP